MHKKQTGPAEVLRLCLLVAGSIVLLSGGCRQPGQPRQRGAFFGSPAGMYFPDPADLGKHRFAPSTQEKNGMVYTCRGGFIDVGHVREAADRTAYLQALLYKNLIQKKNEVFFSVIEPSGYRVVITYPPGWHLLDEEQKKAAAFQTSVQLAQSFAHISLVWHEILTWFGFSSAGIFPEHISAFSWEDTYSDLLGITLAGQVLRDEKPYNQAMAERIHQALAELEAQPPEVARRAVRKIEGKWFTGGFYFFVEMKKRNFETGMDYQPLTPCLVPGICPDARPQPLSAPILSSPTAGGFEADIEIHPVELEKNRIYRILNLDPHQPIRPSVHFSVLLEEIRRQERTRHPNDQGNPPVAF